MDENKDKGISKEEFDKNLNKLLNVPPPDKDKRNKKKSMRIKLTPHKGRTDDVSLFNEDGEPYTKLIIHNYQELVEDKTMIGFYYKKAQFEGQTDFISFVESYELTGKYLVFFLKTDTEADIELI